MSTACIVSDDPRVKEKIARRAFGRTSNKYFWHLS